MRPHPQEDITGNKGLIQRKTGTSLGSPLRSNTSLQRRLLLPKIFKRPGTTPTMDHRTFEEVLPVRNLLHFKLPNLHLSMYVSYYFRHSQINNTQALPMHIYPQPSMSYLSTKNYLSTKTCVTLRNYSWETSQESLSLKFQIKSCSYTTDIIITIKFVNTQLSKSTKSKVV